jgi:hypothetical protein
VDPNVSPSNSELPACLTDEEINLILDDLASYETPEQVIAQRKSTRWEYRRPVELRIARGVNLSLPQAVRAQAHDLSEGGLGLVAPAPLAKGRWCEVVLPDLHGQRIVAAGCVTACEAHLSGAWLCGIAFDKPILIRQFVELRQAG